MDLVALINRVSMILAMSTERPFILSDIFSATDSRAICAKTRINCWSDIIRFHCEGSSSVCIISK